MSSGRIVLKANGQLRVTESEEDGTLELFYQRHLRSLKELFQASKTDELGELVLNSHQVALHSPNGEEFLDLEQCEIEKLHEIRDEVSTNGELFWRTLDELSPRVDEWREPEHEQVSDALSGGRESLAFNLKAQILGGVFFQRTYLTPTPFSEEEWALYFDPREAPMLVNFDRKLVSIRTPKFGLEFSFKEIEHNSPFKLMEFATRL